MARPANIKDVAAKADVSIATVSRYLNGNLARMSKPTAQRVQQAIAALNYVPNSAARQMITKSSHLIAVIVANTDDYFSTELFKGTSAILESSGYIGALLDSDADLLHEQHLLRAVNTQSFDGLIIQPFADSQTIKTFLKRPLPLVVVDREMEDQQFPQVLTNNFAAAKAAAASYQKQGFQRVIVLTSELAAASNRRERLAGIKAAIEDVQVLEVAESSYNYKDVYQQLTAMLKQKPQKTLLFALKERWLLEFVPALEADGYFAADQLAYTGFADTQAARRLTPKMQLISQNPFLMGAFAAELLVKQLKEPKHPAARVVIPAKFN